MEERAVLPLVAAFANILLGLVSNSMTSVSQFLYNIKLGAGRVRCIEMW